MSPITPRVNITSQFTLNDTKSNSQLKVYWDILSTTNIYAEVNRLQSRGNICNLSTGTWRPQQAPSFGRHCMGRTGTHGRSQPPERPYALPIGTPSTRGCPDGSPLPDGPGCKWRPLSWRMTRIKSQREYWKIIWVRKSPTLILRFYTCYYFFMT